MINRVSRIHRIHSPVGVHGALEELAGPEVPEQHQPDPGADGQDVPLEGDGADPAPGVTRGYLPDRLQRPAVQEIRVSLNMLQMGLNIVTIVTRRLPCSPLRTSDNPRLLRDRHSPWCAAAACSSTASSSPRPSNG